MALLVWGCLLFACHETHLLLESQSAEVGLDASTDGDGASDAEVPELCLNPERCASEFLTAAPLQSSEAFAISDDGRFLVGVLYATQTAFRYDIVRDEIVALGNGDGGEDYSLAYALSNDGRVVAGRSKAEAGVLGFRWTVEEGLRSVFAAPENYFFSTVFALSRDGRILAGTATDNEGVQAVYSDPLAVRFPFRQAPENFQEIYGANDDASLFAGRCAEGDGKVACRLSRSGEIRRYAGPSAANNDAIAYDLSESGNVLVGAAALSTNSLNMRRGTVWFSPSSFLHIATQPGETTSRLLAVSSDGRIAVGASDGEQSEALLWTLEDGVRTLDETMDALGIDRQGFHITTANGISGDGRYVVGRAYNRDGVGSMVRIDLARLR